MGRHRHVLLSVARGQCGAAAIEFALTISLVLMLLAGTVGYGVLFWMQQKLTKAAGEGAQSVLIAMQQGELRRTTLAALACDSVRQEAARFSATDATDAGDGDAAHKNAIACTSTFDDCAWQTASAAKPACARIQVDYDPAGWPLMAMMRRLAQAFSSGDEWFSSSLSAHAVIQIPQNPQEPAT